jgi:hypothetical protein
MIELKQYDFDRLIFFMTNFLNKHPDAQVRTIWKGWVEPHLADLSVRTLCKIETYLETATDLPSSEEWDEFIISVSNEIDYREDSKSAFSKHGA